MPTNHNLQEKEPGFKLFEPFTVPIMSLRVRKDPNRLETLLSRLRELPEEFDDFPVAYNKETSTTEPEEVFSDVDIRKLYKNLEGQLKNPVETIAENSGFARWALEQLREEESEIDTKALYQELDTAVRGLYEGLNVAISVMDDRDNLRNIYYQSVFEFGETKFKEGILNYLADEYGFEDVVERAREFETLPKIGNFLRNVQLSDLPLWDDLQNAIEAEKTATGREQGEKSKYSKRIKKEIKEMQADVRKFAEYFDPSFSHINPVKKKFRKVMHNLEKLLEQDSLSVSIVADPTYNPEIDHEAGKIAKDCTAKNSLPFYDPRVHNVKLYVEGSPKDIIGVIYLLENETRYVGTEVTVYDEGDDLMEEVFAEEYAKDSVFDVDEGEPESGVDEIIHRERAEKSYQDHKEEDSPNREDEGRKCIMPGNPGLHIEAYQCPGFNYGTAVEFLKGFLPRLRSAYDREDVRVTANRNPSFQSNFDPCQDAIKQLVVSDEPRAIFQYPEMEIQSGFSGFQGGSQGGIYRKLELRE